MSILDPITTPLEGIALIEASAGTGKTHTITTLVLRLVLEHELRIQRVLVLTYTRAATAELRGRIRGRLAQLRTLLEALVSGAASTPSDDDLDRLAAQRVATREADIKRLDEALRDFDEAPIFTIHGFCQRVLGESVLESRTPFDVELLEDGSALVDEVAADLWERETWRREPSELRQVRSAGLKADEIRGIVDFVVREPTMPIVPELGARPEAPDRKRFDAARLRAAEIWRSERQSLIGLLCVPGVLRGGSYPEDAIRDQWVPVLDVLDGSWAKLTPTVVGKLTPSALSKATNKTNTATKSKVKPQTPEHPFFDACEDLCSAYAEMEQVHKALALYARGLIAREARVIIAQRKAQRGVQGFEDLLHRLALAMQGDEGRALASHIATKYPALLVDEFQDTDPQQYQVFQALHAHGVRTVRLIGDPKQAIYSFRGADVFAYTQAAKEVDSVLRLGTNHRSDPSLVHAVNTLFGQSQDPFGMREVRYQAVEPRPGRADRMTPAAPALQFLLVPRSRFDLAETKSITLEMADVPKLVASEIVGVLRSGARIGDRAVQAEDFAVLCRTNLQGREVQAALAQLGVPAAFDGDSSVFESESAKELLRVLLAIARPGDSRALRSALATALFGRNADDLIELETNDAEHALWLERFGVAHKTWVERSFVQAIHALLMEANVHERLLARRDGQRRLTDTLHVIELLHALAMNEHLGPLSLARRLGALCDNAKDASGGMGREAAQLRLDSDEHVVRITTVHRSKGLEYPIVFCPYLWQSRKGTDSFAAFHDREDGNRLKLDIGGADIDRHKELADEDARAEALRLAYVALTRAQHRCFVVWGGLAKSASSALGHLLHGPPDEGAEEEKGGKKGKGLTDAVLRGALEDLGARCSGVIGVRDAHWDAPRIPAQRVGSPALVARSFDRKLSTADRLTSFSRITREASRAKHEALGEGSDRDAVTREGEQAALSDEGVSAAAEPMPSVTLHAFPAGASAGTLIHSVYEHIDFRCIDPQELPQRVAAELAQAHIDADRHAELLVRGIRESLATPLIAVEPGEPAFTLGSVAPEARVSELEFMLELPRGSKFSPRALAELLERSGSPAKAPGYAQRVGSLRDGMAEGFLRGFIDLVIRRGEKFYVVDYKSNHLGPTAASYAEPRLVAEMESHHYYLQAYLYTLALHRYLQTRVRGYDYERHVGGYLYLFVRGMAESHALGTGVYAERPSRELIEGLSHLLRAKEGA